MIPFRPGRNQACTCGSGRKFKHCCYAPVVEPPVDIRRLLAQHHAAEAGRVQQQGLGKPIISAKHGDYRLVAVANSLRWSKNWRTFPDFLHDYIKIKMGADWGNAELEKPVAERNPIMQWHELYYDHLRKNSSDVGQVKVGPITGIVSCYLGLAYSLYLMDHNAELQAKLIERLKRPEQFQGAFYETCVANALIRAGYELVLEDEDSRASRHCEFAAIKKASGKRYTVEAKMRAVAGLLGRTEGNDSRPLAKIRPHLHDALDKPSDHDRLVFIDINAPLGGDGDLANIAAVTRAIDLLQYYEGHPDAPKERAYIFVTNLAFHRALETDAVIAAAPIGFRIDFNKRGDLSPIERANNNAEHMDAVEITNSIIRIPDVPSTFDGSVPNFGGS